MEPARLEDAGMFDCRSGAYSILYSATKAEAIHRSSYQNKALEQPWR
jgi:hypothetical protein